MSGQEELFDSGMMGAGDVLLSHGFRLGRLTIDMLHVSTDHPRRTRGSHEHLLDTDDDPWNITFGLY